jgi:N-acyl-L-homoserine lactone synthetase
MKPLNRTTLDLIAAAVLFGVIAFSQDSGAQNIAIGGQIEIATPTVVERTGIDQRFLRIATKDGQATLMAIEYDGSTPHE